MTERYKQHDWLYEQYWTLQKSIADVAETAGVATATIRRYLDKHDIETRSLAEANAKGDISKLQDRDWLYTEYIENERSTIDIANELDLVNDTVLKWLNNHGITVRTRSEARSDGDVRKLHDETWLQTEYVEKKRDAPEIAAELGASTDTVYNWLRKHGIGVRDKGISKSNGTTTQLRDGDWLREKYSDDGMSTSEIAEQLSCSKSAVIHWLLIHDIDRRAGGREMSDGDLNRLNNPIYLTKAHHVDDKSVGDIADELNVAVSSIFRKINSFGIDTRGNISDTADYDKLNDDEYLYRQYVEEERSINEIAAVCDCSRTAVQTRLRELDIEIVQYRDHYQPSGLEIAKTATSGDIEKLYDESFVRKQYVEEGRSMVEIASKLEVSGSAVLNALRRYGIERRGYKEAAPTGSEHHNHKPVDTGYYGPNWDEQKVKARVRDHAKCRVCGLTDKEHLEVYGRVNSVHHITPRSHFVNNDGELDYEQANRLENLITLCSKHHPDYEDVPIDNR